MNDREKMLLAYIDANVAPIIVDFMDGNDIKSAIVLPADINVKELTGHYDGVNYLPPKWFNDIKNTNAPKLLVINKIDTISKEEQLKFCELLQYRKISTFDLPDNCVEIVTANEINKDKVNEKVLSLVARI